MANKYARTAGGNWGTDATWSTTSGGSADTTKPIAGDTALLDANSGQVTVDVASACTVLDCTGYTNTLTQGANLTVAGNLTMVAGMTFTPSTYKVIIDQGTVSDMTFTSGGKSFYDLHIAGTGGAQTKITLGDNAVVTHDLTYAQHVETAGAYTITVGGSFSRTTPYPGGSEYYWGVYIVPVTVIMNGTGSIGDATNNTRINGSVTINTAGTITLAGTISFGYSALAPTWTYTAGTVAPGTSTLLIEANCTFNSNGMSWNHVTHNSTAITLSSNMDINGNFLINAAKTFTPGANQINIAGNFTNSGGFTASTSTVVFDGTGTIDGSTTFNNLTFAAGADYTFDDADTFTVSGVFTCSGTSGSHVTLDSDLLGTQTTLTVNGSQVVDWTDATDIDSSLGIQIVNPNGVISNCLNWTNVVAGAAAPARRKLRALMGVGL